MMTWVFTKSMGLFIAETAAKFLTMVTFLLMARGLPAADFGRFTAAMALLQLLVVAVDMGMGQHVAKSAPSDSDPVAARQLGQILTWRILVMAAAWLATPLIGALVLPSSGARSVAVALMPAVLLVSAVDFISWVLKGRRRFGKAVGLVILSRSLLFVAVMAALWIGAPLPWIVTAYIVAAVAGFSIALVMSSTPLRFHRLDQIFLRRELVPFLKLGMVLLGCVLFGRLDLLVVARFLGETQAGLYGCALTVLDALKLIPIGFYGVCLPLFALAGEARVAQRRAFMSAFIPLSALSAIAVMAGSVYAGPVFLRVFGAAYQPSATYFLPLLLSSAFGFINQLFFAFFLVRGDFRTLARALVAGVSVNVLLLMLWLPSHQALGASWAKFMGEAALFGVHAYGFTKYRVTSFSSVAFYPTAIAASAVGLGFFSPDLPPGWRMAAMVAVMGALLSLLIPYKLRARSAVA